MQAWGTGAKPGFHVSRLLSWLGKAGDPALTALSSLLRQQLHPSSTPLSSASCVSSLLLLTLPCSLWSSCLRHTVPSLRCPPRQHLPVIPDPDGCWWGCGQKETLMHCWWACNLVQPLWKTIWSFLKKLKIELQYDLAIPLLGIYQNPKTTNSKSHPKVQSSTVYNCQDMEATCIYQRING